MRRIWIGSAAALVLAVVSGACDNIPSDRLLSVTTMGAVRGVAYLDRNGTGTFEQNVDALVPGISVRLVPRGGGNTTATATSSASGLFSLLSIPVGEYEVRVDNATVPDSLKFIKVDSANVRVIAGDTVTVAVVLSFPSISVRDVRTMPIGKRVFLEGVTHNAFATFGDSTLHVADSTGTIRATRVTPVAITASTKVRLLGTTALQDGQPTITDVTAFSLGTGIPPAPVLLSTSAAASADGGKRDAALVQVNNAVIVGSQSNTAQDVVLSVNDGSGLLDVVVDRQSGIATNSFVPGATLTVTGLLVPSGTPGVWQLKPRTIADLTASFTTVTVAEARTLPVGRVVTIEGVALNAWVTFADSTVHLNDATGSLRATRVAPINLFASDRVRLLGVIALRDGQTILNNVTATVLGVGVLPLPQVFSTALAATADGGRADAALVKVLNATISATATVAGDFILTVSDGSGPLEVVLDKDVGFALAPYVVGATLDVTGVLVTTPGGAQWRLKPRQPADVIVR